jgi:branched-chain amino acid transport system substrate-binding protein
VPLTGPDQVAGRHARQGIQLAAARAGAEGLGVSGRPFTALHADTRGEPEQVQAETVRLLSINRVAALITGPSAACSADAVRAARSYHTPVVVPGILFPTSEGSMIVQLGLSPQERGRALAHYAARSLKAAKAIILSGRADTVAPGVIDGFTQAFSGDTRRMETLEYTDGDREAKLKQAVSAKPDVVLVAGPPADCLSFRTALHKEGLNAPLLYGGADRGPDAFLATIGPGADIYLATAFSTEKLTPRGQEFARRYQDEFHEAPDLAAAEAYDAAWLLFTTINKAQSIAADRLREDLAATESFESLTGSVTFKDRQARRPLFIVRAADGKAHVEETLGP